MHRPALASLSQQERTQLAQLIRQYATPQIVGQHENAPPQLHSDGSVFLSWHRTYLSGLEGFLLSQGHPEWVPLPAWDPEAPIPQEFNIPSTGEDRLRNLNPNISFSPQFDHENLGNFESDEEFGMALMGPHNTVHIVVGGIMRTFRSPEAPIFWPWHSFLDDIWWAWQRITVITPDCTGLTSTMARRLLQGVGLTVGVTTTQPHVHSALDIPFRPEPRIWPPIISPEFPPFPRPVPSIRRRRWHRHVVVDQSPQPGDRVHHGVSVDLVFGMP